MEDLKELERKIKTIDWQKYQTCSEYYIPQEVIDSLLKLFSLKEESEQDNVYNCVLFAIGNNHAGTYYPVILEALDIIIKIALENKNEIARNCALGILVDLSGFTPEIGAYQHTNEDNLEKFMQSKIKDFVNRYNPIFDSERNIKLVKDYFEK